MTYELKQLNEQSTLQDVEEYVHTLMNSAWAYNLDDGCAECFAIETDDPHFEGSVYELLLNNEHHMFRICRMWGVDPWEYVGELVDFQISLCEYMEDGELNIGIKTDVEFEGFTLEIEDESEVYLMYLKFNEGDRVFVKTGKDELVVFVNGTINQRFQRVFRPRFH